MESIQHLFKKNTIVYHIPDFAFNPFTTFTRMDKKNQPVDSFYYTPMLYRNGGIRGDFQWAIWVFGKMSARDCMS